MHVDPSIEGIVTAARELVRDYPQFFEVDLGGISTSTIRLPHPNVDAATMQVYFAPDPGPGAKASETVVLTPVATSEYSVDERNGLLKFKNTDVLGKQCFVAGYHYEWFVNGDLDYYAQGLVDEHIHGRQVTLEGMDPVEVDIIAVGVVARALWSLVTQFATEINVSTPEGMSIPAGQRFQQVQQMLGYWESQYTTKAAALNVGLGATRVFNLRRVSRQTGRLVPIYIDREYDDPRPPQRVFPERLTPITTRRTEIEPAAYQYTAEGAFLQSQDLGYGGWRTIATSGGDPT
jgi:hypothetical protein